ncbi:hypothetical protein [Herbaspirillum sp. RV1423]|uniref:hypothetical protein n=1 Tax=Herbaspirillum sp. RV1423 TaxID=1443993 RepID=UPI0004BA19EA|nr:hypothetical protein [Herbaspirillum sp. RV1423]
MNREQIYSALFAKLAAAPGYKTTSRKLLHWADVKPQEQPALFQAQRREMALTTPGQPTVWSFEVDVYVYVYAKSSAPSQLLNPLLDAIGTALAPDPITNKCRLGGLVEHAWIEGAIQTDEGTLGDQAVAIIPIVIKVVV